MAVEIPKLISVDDHVVEPAHVWQYWLPEKYRSAGPRIERAPWEPVPSDYRLARGESPFRVAADGPPTDFWVYDGNWFGIDKRQAMPGLAPETIGWEPISFDEMSAGCYDPKQRLIAMDENHTERSMCFPTLPRFCGQLFLEGSDHDLGLACVRAYNDWMVNEWAGDSGGRLIPCCLIPMWDGELARDEVVRNAERGVHAVCFTEDPGALGLPSVFTDFWDPFFAACAETDTTVCIHVGSSSNPWRRDLPIAYYALAQLSSEICLVDWLYSGVFARFPALKMAMSESQVGWMPFAFQRIDDVWERQGPRKFAEFPEVLRDRPSSYARGKIFGCAFNDDIGIELRGGEYLGIDCLTFESDYPHTDSTWPNTKAYAEKAFASYSQEEIDKVIRSNAIRMLSLPQELS